VADSRFFFRSDRRLNPRLAPIFQPCSLYTRPASFLLMAASVQRTMSLPKLEQEYTVCVAVLEK